GPRRQRRPRRRQGAPLRCQGADPVGRPRSRARSDPDRPAPPQPEPARGRDQPAVAPRDDPAGRGVGKGDREAVRSRRDHARDAHAAGAMRALGVALANYLVAASGHPTPIAGAYRHIATEALHLVRRSRYQIDIVAIQSLLRMVDWLGGAPEWLLDQWLLR